ncbi:MAG: MFS transporter [Actinobacteria bacterium]|nr:MFS transporter [Actinomycetota bacterium]
MRSLLADTRPLRVPEFRRLWTAWAVANVGQQMTSVAVSLQVWYLTHSPLAVGAIGVCQFVPLVLLGLYGGALSDAHDRRRVGLLASVGLMACSMVLLAQALVGSDRTAILYAVVALQSACFALGNPARQAMIPRLIGRDLLPAANALGMVSFNTGMTVGPLIAGALVAATNNVAFVYAADVLAFTTVLYATFKLPSMPPLPLADGSAPRRAGLASIVEGLTFLKGRTNLQVSLLIDVIAMVLGMPRALFPAIADMWFNAGGSQARVSALVGFFTAAIAIGAVAAGLLSGPLQRVHRHGRAVTVAVVVWGAAIALFGVSRSLPLSLVCLAIAGAADTVSAVFRSTMLQSAAPDEYRGRLQGVFTVVVAGGPRLGDLEAGAVATALGLVASVVSGGVGCVVLAVALVAWRRSFWHYDARNPEP